MMSSQSGGSKRRRRQRRGLVAVGLIALVLAGIAQLAFAHSTHSGIVSWGGCNVNPKKPKWQTYGSNGSIQVWGVTHVGQGCGRQDRVVYSVAGFSVDGGTFYRYPPSQSTYIVPWSNYNADSTPIKVGCAGYHHYVFRSISAIGTSTQNPQSDYHRDADERLDIWC